MRFVKIRRNRIDDTNIKSERIMAKIAVVGMGQGGMVAAIRLAKQGHDVTVFEKSKRGEVSYDWRDDIRADVFEAVGIPSLFMINKKGETRPMVDLTGKFYLLDELDETFVKE